MTVDTYTKSGNKSTAAAVLNSTIFGETPINHDLIKKAYVAYLANCRDNLAKVKTRGLVSGGGRKPWKQKGTGRARVGSSRTPIWRGGGQVFGPTGNETFNNKLTTKTKRKTLRQVLSLKVASGAIKIIERFDCKEGRVGPTIKLLKKIGSKGSVLIVVDEKDTNAELATRNLQYVKCVTAKYLNTYDVLNADTLVIEQSALNTIHDWLGGGLKK